MESSSGPKVWTDVRFAFLRLSVLTVFAAFTAAPPVAGQASSKESRGSRIAAREQVDASEARKISLWLDDVTLEAALKQFVKESGFRFTYSRDVVSLDKKVSLEVKDRPAIEMLKLLLAEGGLEARKTHVGQYALVAGPPPARPEVSPVIVATVAGQVTDATSGEPLAGTSISVVGTRLGAFTADDGRYQVSNVPAGEHRIRAELLGYQTQTRTVTVPSDGTLTVDFALAIEPTRLEEIVATATGEQRRVELGHVLGSIKADSLVKETMVTTLSEVLGARVPGLQVIQNSGQTGEAPRIYIRGVNSVSLPNDQPLLYIDGVRVDNGSSAFYLPGDLGNSFSYGLYSGGRFNDLNPEEIESIEIVKGPSAATLYGTDAANGVILIQTKRGQAGETRWNFYAETGILEPAVEFDDQAYSWGTNTSTGDTQRCIITQIAAGTCTVDSLTFYSPLNDPSATPIQTGLRSQYGAQVSGGVERFRFFVAGEYESERSYLEMPASEIERIREERGGGEIPDWQRHPSTLEKFSLRGNVNASMGDNAEITVTSGLSKNNLLLPRPRTFSSGWWGPGYKDALGGWYNARPGELYAIKSEEDVIHYTGSINGTWRILPWLTTRGTLGLDFSSAQYEGLQRRDEGLFGTGRDGQRMNARTATTMYTLDFGGSAVFDLTPTINSRTSIGLQSNRRLQKVTLAEAAGLPPGSETVAGAVTVTGRENTDENIVAGGYLEQTFGLNERLFLTAAVRLDGASNFGRNFETAAYPKVSGSWLLSEEAFFPEIPSLNTLRIRAAYGESGVQPGSTDALTLVALLTSYVDGASTNGAAPSALGNPDLKPERSTEFEAGLDLELWENRIVFEGTYYNRLSKDALIARPLPPSVGFDNRWENVGEVRNSGWEGMLTARIIQNSSIGWEISLNGTINDNVLEKIGLDDVTFIGANPCCRVREGYPLWSRWDRPILGYDDANGDGIIDASEVEVGDTVAFLGNAQAPKTLTVSSSLSLFSNRLTISSQFDVRRGSVGMNFTELNRCGFFTSCPAVNDPTAPLWEQARAAAYFSTGTWAGYIEDDSFTRWRELSATYRAPQSLVERIGASSLSLTLAARNLMLWTSYTSPDPESNSGGGTRPVGTKSLGNSDNPTFPQTRYVTVRVNIGF